MVQVVGREESAAERLRHLNTLDIIEQNARRARRGEATDPERSEREAARRARTNLRRWCIANRVDHMWTFTLALAFATHSEDEIRRRIEAFRRAIEAAGFGPWVCVIEPHPGGHGWHVHAGCHGFVPIEIVRQAWTWGHVWVSWKGPHPHGRRQGPMARARTVAAYLGKYLAKDFGEREDQAGAPTAEPEARTGGPGGSVPTVGFNRKRYSCSRGYLPRCERERFNDDHAGQMALRSWLYRQLGGDVDQVWSSADVEDWQGPHTVLLVRRE